MEAIHDNDSANSRSEGPAHRRLIPRALDGCNAGVLPALRFIPYVLQDCCIACPASIEKASAAKLDMPRGSFGYLCPGCLACDDATLRARLVHKISYWRDLAAKERSYGAFKDSTYADLAGDLITLTTAGFTVHPDGIEPWLDQIGICGNPMVRTVVKAAVLGQAVKS